METAFMRDIMQEKPGTLLRERRAIYLMINAIAKRAHQLQNGEKALALPSDGSRDAVKIATLELMEDKLEIFPISGPGTNLSLVESE